MKLTEEQLTILIRESVKNVLKEYAYHEKQHKPSEEEHASWIKKKAEAKKKYYDALKTGDGKDDSKSVDYYDYKHGDHPVITKETTVRLSSSGLQKVIMECVKGVISETRLDYDIDNFSGRWNRGQRCDILVNGDTYYSDIPEETVDKLYNDLLRRGYSSEEIQIVDL